MIFIPEVWVFVTWPTRITIIGLLPLPYVFIYLGNQTSPQTTTPATLERYRDIYPYDFKLFYPDLVCRTCRLTKPARSKHCSLCCFCVARADHHCVWLNNCVGRGNYKYFISLLVSLIAVLSFTLWQAYYTLAMQLKQCANVEQSHYLIPCANPDAFDVPLVKMHIKDLVQAAFKIRGVARIATGTAAFVFIPMPVGLLSYHIYLIYTGMTTSEKSRWERWRGEVAAGSAFLAPVQLATDSGYQRSDWHKSTWPNRSSQVLVATSDGHPPRKLPEQIAAVVGEAAEWHRCSTLEQVENIYDLGPWRNLLHVLAD